MPMYDLIDDREQNIDRLYRADSSNGSLARNDRRCAMAPGQRANPPGCARLSCLFGRVSPTLRALVYSVRASVGGLLALYGDLWGIWFRTNPLSLSSQLERGVLSCKMD